MKVILLIVLQKLIEKEKDMLKQALCQSKARNL